MSDSMQLLEPVFCGDDATSTQAAEEATHWSLQVNDHGHDMGAYQPTAVELGVVGLALIILIASLCMSVRYLFRPGETDKNHIKRRILRDGGPA
jgi:hypothetical protein